MSCQSRQSFRLLPLVAVAVMLGSSPVEAANDSSTVLVWKRIATALDPITVAHETAHALPTWAITRTTQAVSTFVSKLYRLDPATHAPQLAAITDKVAALNAVAPDATLHANHSFIVPFVARALSGGARTIPFLSVDLRNSVQVQTSVGPQIDRFVKFIGEASSGFSIAIREMAIGQAQRALQDDASLEILSAPLDLHEAAADDGDSGPPYVLSPSEAAIIRIVSSMPVQQHPLVVILDSLTPDRDSETQSRAFALSAVAALRTQAGLPPLQLSDAQCGAGVADSQWTDPPMSGRRSTHTVEVQSSLKDFQAAANATAAAPRVVYLPLLRRTRCEAETLRQIIQLHYLMTKTGGDVSKRSQRDIADGFRSATDHVISRLARSVTSTGIVATDTEVANAVLYLVEENAAETGAPIFTSMPWTFDPGPFDPKPPNDTGGLYIVAGGNYGKLPTIETNQAQFPLRSLKNGDTLAVMNVGLDGKLLCRSTIVSRSGHAFATSFYGAIPGDCGTSFSAPRVAWLLALREAVRPRTVIPAALAGLLRVDASIGGQIKSEGGGTVLDIKTLFNDELTQVSAPAGAVSAATTSNPEPLAPAKPATPATP